MQVTKTSNYYLIEHKGAAYNIKVDQVSERRLFEAAEFLSNETMDYILVDDIELLINELEKGRVLSPGE